jgi:BASS family bile acid:Na+ symporter
LLETILSFGPPVILIVGMIGVGLSMTRRVVLSVTARPGSLVAMTALQTILLPAAGIVTVLATSPPPAVSLAILLIAACPGGGISNLYVLFARANTSLSVLMTLTSIALASLTLPGALAAIRWLGFETIAEGISPATVALKLIGVIVVPVAIGMAVRAYAAGLALRWEERLRTASALMILAILAAVLWLEQAAVLAVLPQMALSAAVFLGLALAFGTAVGRVLYSSNGDRFAVMTEFVVRNLAIGVFVAVGLVGDLTFAGPAAVYLLLEAVVLILLAQARRGRLKRAAAVSAGGRGVAGSELPDIS